MAAHDDHKHGQNGHDRADEIGLDELGPPRFVDVVAWLADESSKALAEEGEHASVVFLGMPDGSGRAQRFDATGQHDVAAAWGRVATWAKGVSASAVYF